MRRTLADALRALGPAASLPNVAALYEPLLAAQARDSVSVLVDQRYGRHERQELDVYRCPEHEARPVLVWVHGGGFIRGDKGHRSNIGYWGAREGFVTVLPNYRLAPMNTWPSGPRDIVEVWRWLREHVHLFGGDPHRIVFAGESAGAAHVAAACLMRRFQPEDWQIAGAVLLSGPYNAKLEGLARMQLGIATPDARNDAYFGPDRSTWAAASIIEHIDAQPFPLWISFAEQDLLQMQVQAGELFARLVCHHGFSPELQRLRDHNHFSPGYSIGTEDTALSRALSEFICRCTTSEPARLLTPE
jgi:acetyl esterase/lipase